MKRVAFLLAGIVALGLVACVSPTEQNQANPLEANRQISDGLRASCPLVTASRMTRDSGALLELDTMYLFSDSVFDDEGKFISQSEFWLSLDSADLKKKSFFIGVIDRGAGSLTDGNYFLYYLVKDSSGVVIDSDSTCLYYKSSTSS